MAAAVGMPDEYAGELPVVYVQLRQGQTASSDELQQFAFDHIAERPACPKRVFQVQALSPFSIPGHLA
ncbi:AMP-binding domain protein [compost metagenome]